MIACLIFGAAVTAATLVMSKVDERRMTRHVDDALRVANGGQS